MATSKQLEANRRNALASTGPRTEAGKAVVRLNNFRHGLRCDLPVIAGVEQEADWLDHLEGVRASLDPANPLEDALAARVAMMLWRLNRVARYETAMIGVGQEQASAAVRKVDNLDSILKPNRPAVHLKAAIEAQERHSETSGWAEPALAALEALEGSKVTQVSGDEAWCLLDTARDALEVEADFEDADFLTGVGASDFEHEWTVGMLRAALARLAGYVRKWRKAEKALTDRVRESLEARQEESRKTARRLARDVREAEEAVAAEERQARLRRLMPEDAVLQSVSRYETHLEKGLTRTLDELYRLQSVRSRNRGTAPVVLEMTVGED